MVEHLTFNQRVRGSNPLWLTLSTPLRSAFLLPIFSSDFHEKIYKYDFHSMTVTPFIGIIMSMKVIDGGEIMDFSNFFNNLSTLKIITSILDILIVWYVLYLLITVFKGTKAIQLLKGILFIVIGQQVSKLLNLTATSKLFDIVIQWGVLALIVIFQPEIRRALEQLGRGSLFKRYTLSLIHI